MGQCHTFCTQTVNFHLFQLSAFTKNTGCNTGRKGGGGIVPVHGIFQRTGFAAIQCFYHAGIGAVAVAHLRNPEHPKVVAAGLVITSLPHCPFLLGKVYIADEGSHFSVDLSTGQTQQHAVAGKSCDLGVRRNLGIAVAQVIAHQTVGTVIFLNLLPCFGVHRITHGITDGKSQQTAAVGVSF